MKLRTLLVTGLVMCTVVIGSIEPLWAKPDGSQRLRGLGDRVFLVTAELTDAPEGFFIPIGAQFPNCYIFEGEADMDGYNWFETAFPAVNGVFVQDSNGAKTSYVVEARDSVNNNDIRQWGQVTPARGKGNLRLIAISTVDFGPEPDGAFELEFLSIGEAIDASEVESRCPFPSE